MVYAVFVRASFRCNIGFHIFDKLVPIVAEAFLFISEVLVQVFVMSKILNIFFYCRTEKPRYVGVWISRDVIINFRPEFVLHFIYFSLQFVQAGFNVDYFVRCTQTNIEC